MALAALKTWSAGEVLTAADLNAEFANLYNNLLTALNPLTGNLDMDGFEIILDADGDLRFGATADNRLDIKYNSSNTIFRFSINTAVTLAENGLEFVGVGSGQAPFLRPYAKTDVNVNLQLRPLGTGNVVIADVDGRKIGEFSVPATGQAANYIKITAGSAGTGAAIAAAGSDTNIDLVLNPKGAGDIVIDGIRWPTADGSLNQAIVSDGAGKLSFSNVGGWTLLAVDTANADATVDIALATGYDQHMLVLSNLCPPTATAPTLYLQFSQDGGVTFQASADSYSFISHSNRGGVAAAVETAAFYDTANSTLDLTGYGVEAVIALTDGVCAEVFIHGAADATVRTTVNGKNTSPTQAGGVHRMQMTDFSGWRNLAEANTHVRIAFSGQNTNSGKYKLYGLPKAL